MGSKAQAQEIIRQVWNENTIGGTIGKTESSVGRLIQNALTVLSNDLYGKPTHFLMEMIQNADDNTYENSIPTLNLTYRPGSLRVDCNEVGFSERNVRAICNIGTSTKTGLGNATRYIGEKGIGFKSVFKVAKVVYISSGHFSFKFDKSEKLGLVAPIWCKFPQRQLQGYTSFFLELADDCDETQIVQELRELDAKILIFLRQLRRIDIDIEGPGGVHVSRQLGREDEAATGALLTTLTENDESSRFIIIKHTVRNLPREQKRPGCTQSEVLLAFPALDPAKEATLKTQSVYAFLPVYDCGLKFSLQGDFILTANRQDIVDSPWNHALLDASAHAFLAAVRHFNSGPMKYCWPQYLPAQALSGFFRPLEEMIRDILLKQPILEGWDRNMRTPSGTVYVPSQFTCDDGVPFTLNSRTKFIYASRLYPSWAMRFLSSIGVRTMYDKMLVEDLKWTLEHEATAIHAKSGTWHSQMARSLRGFVTNEIYGRILRAMPLIPLRNGEWAPAQGRTIFFGSNARGLEIPKTLTVDIIDPDAESDAIRRSFFFELGVKPSDGMEISLLILKMHDSAEFNPQKYTVQQLLDHVTFMFRSRFQPPPGSDIWFATAQGGRCKGSSLYTHGNYTTKSILATIMKQLAREYPFIHGDYRAAIPEQRNWMTWIQNSFSVASIPRISYPSLKQSDLRMSPEFSFICRAVSSSDLLSLLQERWGEYSKYLDNISQKISGGDSGKTGKTAIIEAISTVLVVASCGKLPLRDTVLPGLDQNMDKQTNLPTLVLPPGNRAVQQWSFLEWFGVSARNGAEYYLRCLRSLQRASPAKGVVAKIYSKIQAEYNGNESLIWKSFRSEKLIYTVSGSTQNPPKMRWIDSAECIKNGFNIEAEYDESAVLFRCLLATGKGEVGPLVAMATMISPSLPLEKILERLKKINQSLPAHSADQAKKVLTPLLDKEIIPIVRSKTGREFDKLVAPNQLDTWFIADRDHLRESFLGRTNLLAFQAKDWPDLKIFLTALGFEKRLLSVLVRSKSSPAGRIKLHSGYTEFMRDRSPFLAALVSKLDSNYKTKVAQIEKITVNTAQRIVCKYFFEINGHKYYGQDGEGDVASSTSDCLNLYLTEEEIDAWPPPQALFDIMVSHCGIKELDHRDLAHLTLNEKNETRLRKAFERQGLYISEMKEIGKERPEKKKPDKYLASQRRVTVTPEPRSAPTKDGNDVPGGKAGGDKWAAKFASVSEFTLKDGELHDRRLPENRYKVLRTKGDPRSDPVAESSDSSRSPGQKANTTSQYFGELMTCKLFQQHLAGSFNPNKHWTSSLRAQAGYSKAEFDPVRYASFTFTESSIIHKINSFLYRYGFHEVHQWTGQRSTYHFDVAISADDEHPGTFIYTSAKFERMRNLRMPSTESRPPNNVVFLMHISKIHSVPRFELIPDPWRQVMNAEYTMSENYSFMAKFVATTSPSPGPPGVANGTGVAFQSQYSATSPGSINSQYPASGASLQYFNAPFVSGQNSAGYMPQPSSYAESYRNYCASLGYTDWTGTMPPQSLPPVDSNHSTQSQHYPKFGSFGHSYSGHAYGAMPPYYHNVQGSYTPYYMTNYAAPNSRQPHRLILNFLNPGDNVTYTYKPLQPGQIRLLLLSPGDGATLRGTVFEAPLKSAGEYRAVSYTWGNSTLSHSLWTADGVIKISKSLYQVFQTLIHEKEMLTLWVDAICINQNDLKEKANQIRLLPHIFQRAERVLGCISAGEVADGALETLMQIHAQEIVKTCNEQWPPELARVPESWKDKSIPPPGDPSWIAIREFFRNPWFRRAWIIQEVVAAFRVSIIHKIWRVEWNDLAHAVDVINQHMPSENSTGDKLVEGGSNEWDSFAVLSQMREKEATGHYQPLLDLLETFRSAESTLRRDRFFCLLGLSSDGNEEDFEPDYELDLAVIVKRFASCFVRQGKVLELIHNAGMGTNPAKFPSWIPDWTMPRPPGLRSLAARGMPCKASPVTTASFELNPGSDEIQIKGANVDKIALVSEAKNTPEEMQAYVLEAENILNFKKVFGSANLKWRVPIAGCRYPPSIISGQCEMATSYRALREYQQWKNPQASRNATPTDEPAWETSKRKSKKKKKQAASPQSPVQPTPVEDGDPTVSSLWTQSQTYIAAIQDNAIRNWRLVVTERNFAGLAPEGARVGDVVVILDGGMVPFLLRASEWRKGAFQLVGECFVDGFMEGEAVSLAGIQKGMIRLH